MKKISILILSLIVLSSNVVFGEEVVDLSVGTPKYLTLAIEGSKFKLDWINSIHAMTKDDIQYQLDFKVGRDNWLSDIGRIKSFDLEFNNNGKTSIIFDPIEEGITNTIDLEKNSYSFRVRYKDNNILGNFSNIVSLGLKPYYENASEWAWPELDLAVELKLIPDSIRLDMKKPISREEFCEVVINLYQLQTGETINPVGLIFNDTINPDVLKAATLGVVKGDGSGNFLPEDLITRQEIAVILRRLLEIFYPDMDFDYVEVEVSEETIATWAYDDMQFMLHKEILRGDQNGRIHPTGHTTREEAVVVALRLFNKFN